MHIAISHLINGTRQGTASQAAEKIGLGREMGRAFDKRF